jgi:hypothetical protein
VVFTVAFIVCIAGFVDARAHGDGEGGAPLVVLAMVLTGVVVLDAVARGVAAGLRRVIGGQRRRW